MTIQRVEHISLSIYSRWVKNLCLQYFRNYLDLSLQLECRPVILTGPNGAGKTNILEAISLLSSGKGLRKAKLSSLSHAELPHKEWVVSAEIGLDPHETIHIGTAFKDQEQRLVKINQSFQPQTSLIEWVTILWQTPQMDFIFADSPSKRRKFFDKLVGSFVPEYTQHLYRYEHATRERSRLLKEKRWDAQWIKILEQTIAQEAIASLSLRQFYIENLTPFLRNKTAFPQVSITIEGTLEKWFQEYPALETEERFQEHLKDTRSFITEDQQGIGLQYSLIGLHHVDLNKPLELCSTGEQKALLLSVVLANCRLQTRLKSRTPILLLDEIVAHLDEERRRALFEEIVNLGLQAWLTGTDLDIFRPLQKEAQYFQISHGNVLPKAL